MNKNELMKETTTAYGKLRTETDSFFDQTLQGIIVEADQIIQKRFTEWLKEMHRDFLKRKSDEADQYKLTVEVLEEKLNTLDEVLKVISENSRLEIISGLLRDEIGKTLEVISEKQSQARFVSIEEDGVKSRFLKAGKRGFRFLAAAVGKKEWTQNIRFRDLLAGELFSDTVWIETWIAESFKDTSEILDLFLEKKEPDQTTENGDGERNTPSSFDIEVVYDFEKHLEKAIKRIESREILKNSRLVENIDGLKRRLLYRGQRSGTVEGGKARIRFSEIQKSVDKKKPRFREIQKSWIDYLESQAADLRIQTEIAAYGQKVSEVQSDILTLTHSYFRDFGYMPLEQGVSSAGEIAKELSGSKSEKLSKKLVESIRNRLEKEIKETILTPMKDLTVQKEMMANIRSGVTDLQMELSGFTENIRLAEERAATVPVPLIKFDELRWRSLASRFIQEKGLRHMEPDKLLLVEFIDEMALDVEETIQVVDINLMAALESKVDREEEQSPLEIAVGGVKRSVNIFEKSIKRVREKQNEYEKIVKEQLPEALHELSDTMLRREYDKFELRDKALQAKQKATRWKDRFRSFFGGLSQKTEIAWRFTSQKFKKGKIVVLGFLGFRDDSVLSTTEKNNLTVYLSKAGVQRNLPFIYKRLFDPGFEIDSRFYVAPNGMYTSVEIAWEGWKKGLDSNVIIIGEKGSGKSTAIRSLSDTFFKDEQVTRLKFDQTFFTEAKLIEHFCDVLNIGEVTGLLQLIEEINKKKKRQVIIVENLHNAFVRNLHGFEALNSFWILMSATREKMFWVVSTSRYSWKFFEKISDAGQYFSHLVEADTLSQEQIRKAVMSRHKATGYELKFEPGQMLKNNRTFRRIMDDEEKVQEYLRDFYFSRLANVAEGNLSIAIIFWLQSIGDFDEKTFQILPLEIADVDKLEVPARKVLFTLAAFVLHDRLNDEEMAMALHQPESECRLMLTRLKSKGIINKTENGYLMNHLVYRQVIRLLKRRNIIH